MSYNNKSNEADTMQELTNLFRSGLSIQGYMNTIKLRLFKMGCANMIDKLSIKTSYSGERSCKMIIDWLQGKGIRFNVKHTTELKISKFSRIIPIDKRTFMYFEWDPAGSNDVYFLGKNSYRYYKQLSKALEGNDISESTTTLYSVAANGRDNSWSSVRSYIRSRDFSTLYFNHGVEGEIREHLDKWLANRDIYNQRGIKFKTGFLFYGVPGTGKSSLANAIANYLKCNIINIDMATFKDLDITSLTNVINADDPIYVLVLDDIDVILSNRDDSSLEDKENISKLLSFLDSNTSPDNVCFVATTNKIELFDDAITRAGRFDKIMEIGNINHGIAKKMCLGFDLSESDADDIIASHSEPLINPAILQVEILNKIKRNLNNEG